MNEWNDAKKAWKLPTLLEGKPSSIMVRSNRGETSQIQNDERKDHFQNSANCLFVITGFSQLQNAIWSSNLFELKRLLDQTITGLATEACDRLLIHQCLVELLESVSRQLWAISDTGNLDRLQKEPK